MKDLQIRIQQMLNEKKNHNRAVALITALSLLMMFIVPYVGVMPGAAITTENGTTNWNDSSPYFSGGAVTEIPDNSGFTDLSGKITGATFTIGDTEYTSTNGSDVTIEGASVNPVSFGVKMSYSLTEAQLAAIIGTKDSATGNYTGGVPYAYFKLDDKVKPDQSYYGDGRIITDEAWSKTKVAGYYSIAENGLIVFHYSDEYIQHLRGENDKNNGGLNGTVSFNANVARNQDEGGDVDFYFDRAKVHVNFDDTIPTIKKEGRSVKLDSDYGIDWKITITNPNGYVDLNQYAFTDELNGTAIDWTTVTDFTISPSGAASQGANGVVVFDNIAQENRPTEIIITYRQTGVQLGDTNTNYVELTKGDTNVHDSRPVTVENGLNISKSGTPDYELGAEVNNKIRWTVHVDHKSGDSLKNVVVTETNYAFDATGADLVVYDSAGNVINSNLYTVSGNTLTFVDDASVPTSVDIVFWGSFNYNSDYPESNYISNSVNAQRADIQPPVSTESSLNYYHNMNFSKELSHVNQETGNIEWQFTLTANNGGNSTDDIYGYTIQDPAFASLTQEQINSMIGFNVYHRERDADVKQGDQLDNTNLNVQLTKVEGHPDTIRITFNQTNAAQTINKIKMYYQTSIQDYVSSEDWATYTTGGTITLSNSATAKDSGENQSKSVGPITQDIKQRMEASKSYEGARTGYSFGNEDLTDKILSWKVDLTKDAGFKEGDKYTDTLKSAYTDENKVTPVIGHYVIPSQRSGLTLLASTTKGDTATKVTLVAGTDYTIKWLDANGTEVAADANASKFEITFTNAVDSAKYHYVYIDYNSTAMTSEVPAGYSVKFSNGYNFGADGEQVGMTYTRDNPADVKDMTLNLKKIWQDNSNVFEERPEIITVKLYRVEADENGNLPADPDWGIPIETKVLTVDMSNNEKTYQLGTEYPQWRYDSESQKVIKYYYKVEEVLPSGSVYAYTTGGSVAVDNPSNQDVTKELSLTNTSSKDFGKVAVDSSGNKVTQLNTLNVPIETVDVDGTATRCFMFRWEIIFEPGVDLQITDTLPNGSVFVNKDSASSTYRPIYGWDQYNNYTIGERDYDVKATISGENVVFDVYGYNNGNPKSMKYIIYYTAIPIDSIEDSLDENGNLVNSVTKGSKTETASVHVINTPIEEEADYLTKAFNQGTAAGYLNYTIDVNPTGKKLSNTGYIDITDTLSYLGGDVSLENLNVVLDEINVYPLVNGAADENNPLNPGTYNYTLEYDQAETTSCPVNVVTTGKKWELTGWEPGDSITITLDGPADYNGGWGRYGLQSFNFDSTDYGGTTLFAEQYFDSSGTITRTVTVPSDAVRIALFDWGNSDYVITSVSATITKNYPAKLYVSVPDQTPLQISYSYAVSGWKKNDTLTFANTASFHADNGEGSWSTNNDEMNSNSDATAETNKRPKIYKVAVNDYSINDIQASFAVAKYVDGEWIYANSVTTEGTGNNKYRVLGFPETPAASNKEGGTPLTYASGAALLRFASTDDSNTTGDDESVHEFSLVSGTLYKFVEVSVESTYKQPNWTAGFDGNEDFVFYYAYDGYSGSVPEEAENNVRIIQKAGTVNIPNNQAISVSAQKSFSGTTADVTAASGATVVLKLYWSFSRSGTNLTDVSSDTLDVAANYPAQKTITYSTSNASANTVSWNNLPTGKNGAPVYYFVREESYTYNGTPYTYDATDGKYRNGTQLGKFQPVYTANGTNTADAVIEVNNSEGITVKKLWLDSNGNAITNIPKDTDGTTPMAVPFIVKGEKDGVKYPLTLPVTELTSPSYSYQLPDTVTDATGEHPLSYYDNFEVVENLSAEQKALLGDEWTTSTTRKITNGTGTLEIINEKQAEVMTVDATAEKVWVGTAKDSISVKLIQTTDTLTPTQLLAANADNYGALSNGKDDAVVSLNGTAYYTFASAITSVTNIAPTGLCTAVVDGTDNKKLVITGGSAEGSGTITVTFADGEKTINVAVISQTAALTTGHLTKTWSGLPKYADDGTTEYHYYVIETSKPLGYNVSYTISGQKTTITNTKEVTSLFVQKVWRTGGTGYTSLSPEFTLYRRSGSSGAWVEVTADAPTVSKNDKIWTYTFVGLDKYDNNGNEYQFKVEETAISGYETAYSNNNGTTGGNSSTPIVVTNTELTSLAVRKEWSDGADKHGSDEITVVLHRSTDLAVVPVVTTIGSSTSSTTSSTTTTTTEETTTTTDETTTSEETTTTTTAPNVITINDSTFYLYPVDSSKTVTVVRYYVDNTDGSNVAQPFWYPFYSESNYDYSTWRDGWITAGQTGTVEHSGLNLSGVSYIGFKANSEDGRESSIKISNIVVEYANTVIGTYSSDTSTHVSMKSEDSPITSGKNVSIVLKGEPYQTAKVGIGGSTDSNWSGWINTNYNAHPIEFNSEGNATVQITTDNVYYFPQVCLWDYSGTRTNVSLVSYTISDVSTPDPSPAPPRVAPPTQPETTSSTPVSSPLTAQHVYRVGKLTRAEEIIEENEEVETISQAVSVLLKPRVILLASSSSDWVTETNGQAKTITFSATDSWQWTDSLPMYDASGHKYYYWVEETAITGNSTLTAFDVAYKFDDGSDDTTYCIDAELHGNGEITIRNTPKESQAGVLPESGSTGTRIYYLSGAMLLLLAAAGYATYSIKRRRWLSE